MGVVMTNYWQYRKNRCQRCFLLSMIFHWEIPDKTIWKDFPSASIVKKGGKESWLAHCTQKKKNRKHFSWPQSLTSSLKDDAVSKGNGEFFMHFLEAKQALSIWGWFPRPKSKGMNGWLFVVNFESTVVNFEGIFLAFTVGWLSIFLVHYSVFPPKAPPKHCIIFCSHTRRWLKRSVK